RQRPLSGHSFISVDCLERRRYAPLVELGASPPAALKGDEKVKLQRAHCFTARFRHPGDYRPRKRYVGGQGKAVGCVPPTALLSFRRLSFLDADQSADLTKCYPVKLGEALPWCSHCFAGSLSEWDVALGGASLNGLPARW